MSDNNAKKEKKEMNAFPLDVLSVLITIFMLIGILFLFTTCKSMEGRPMCYFANKAAIIAASVNIVLSLAKIVIKALPFKRIFAIMMILVTAFIMIAPGTLFPLCKMETMSCLVSFKPGTLVIGGLTIAILILEIIVTIVKGKK